jgi:hypothetical protein
MKKGVLILFFVIVCIWSHAQNPFIVPSDGIGKYGYIDAEAVTYNKLSSNSFDNVYILAARWWAEGTEFIQEYTINSCGGVNTVVSTTDFSHTNFPNWDAGEKAFVSVYTNFCFSGTWSQTGTGTRPDGQTGFSERQFMKIDVNTNGNITLASSIQDNTNNLVGTFVINSGSEALTLDRLWIINTGTAEEVNDIPNASIKIYYEAVTGTEEFNGTEDNKTIYGDYSGNATNNGEFGSDDLNISIAANIDLRCYVVITDLNDSYTPGRTAQFSILNDGISFEETLDGSYNLMRIDQLNISTSSIALPVEFTKLSVTSNEQEVILNWQTATETNNSHFEVEQSTDGKHFRKIGEIAGAGTTHEVQDYEFVDINPTKGTNYYRLKQVDISNGMSIASHKYSKIVHIESNSTEFFEAKIYPNPVIDILNIKSPLNLLDHSLKIHNSSGQLIYQAPFNKVINVSNFTKGLYSLTIYNPQNQLIYQIKFVK